MRDEWIDARLAEHGRRRSGPTETFRERPWADVFRVPTDDGSVWLKVPSPETAAEVGLYAVLADVVPARILVPLGVDLERRWLLLPDGGPTLAERLPGTDRLPELEHVLAVYGELQRSVAPSVNRLLELGLLDMSPTAMPGRYEEALAKVASVRGPELRALRPRFAAWCAELASAPGGVSLDHNDLHGENILSGPRFYDWGDAVVAHPFASMLMGLGVMTLVLDCGEADPRILRLRDAYLEAWSDLAPHAELVRTLELACRVGKVARALTWHRAIALAPDADPEWRAAPEESLTAVLDERYLTGF